MVIIVVVLLMATELIFRIFYPAYQKAIFPRGLYVKDEIRDHKMESGFKGRHRHEEFDILININSLGMREDEIGINKAGLYTIANIGDSFTFGYGLNREDTISFKLGYKLSGSYADFNNIRSLNLGVVGYGCLDSFIFLEEAWDKIKPNLAIYYLFIGNDALNDLNTQARIDNPGISEKHYVTQPLVNLLQNNCALYDFLFKRLKNNRFLSSVFLRLGIRKFQRYLYEKDSPFYKEGFSALTANILKMRSYIEGKGGKLLVVLIPEDMQVFYEGIIKEKGLDSRKPQNDLIDFCQKNKIHYVDLLDGLQDFGFRAYFKYDSHFNAKGSDFVAGKVAQYLLQHEKDSR